MQVLLPTLQTDQQQLFGLLDILETELWPITEVGGGVC